MEVSSSPQAPPPKKTLISTLDFFVIQILVGYLDSDDEATSGLIIGYL